MKSFKMRLVTLLMVVINTLSVFQISAFAATTENISAVSTILNVEAERASLPITHVSGWGQAWTDHAIYAEPDGSVEIIGAGVLKAGVGFTIVAETDVSYQINMSNRSDLVWISKDYVTVDLVNCKAGDVRYTATVYGAAGSNIGNYVGTVYAGNIVSILAKSGNYYFIEFNDSTYVRKRGWVIKDAVLRYGSSEVGDMDTLIGNTSRTADRTLQVFYAPGPGYTSAYASLYTGASYTLVQYTSIHGKDYALISFLTSSGGQNKLALGYIEV